MRYLHTMLRVRNLDAALDFYCNKLGLQEVRRRVSNGLAGPYNNVIQSPAPCHGGPTPPRSECEAPMRYLHTMLRVRDLDAALDFYCNKLGLKEVRRRVDEKNRYTLVFLAGPEDEHLVEESKRANGRDAPLVELTYNWDSEDYGEARHFGHLAYEVDDIYATCEKLMRAGVTINRPPRDGMMAFVRSPDKHSIELLQKGNALPPREPWVSMPNTGKW